MIINIFTINKSIMGYIVHGSNLIKMIGHHPCVIKTFKSAQVETQHFFSQTLHQSKLIFTNNPVHVCIMVTCIIIHPSFPSPVHRFSLEKNVIPTHLHHFFIMHITQFTKIVVPFLTQFLAKS